MNFNTLSGSAKLHKKLEVYATGQITASGEVPNIAILCAVDRFENQKLVDCIATGVKNQGGIVTAVNVPAFGYFNKINPMTAKFASSFIRTSASSAEAIIKCGLYDGIVIVADCDVTTAGLLQGAAKANCPALVMSIGICFGAAKAIDNYKIQGKITSGQVHAEEGETLIEDAKTFRGSPHTFNSNSTFFILMEAMGFSVPSAGISRIDSPPLLRNAIATGEQICESAKSILAPKKFLTHENLYNAIAICLSIGGDINAIALLENLVRMYEPKTPHTTISEVCGKVSLLLAPEDQNTGYIQQIGGIWGILKQLSGIPKLIDDDAFVYTGDKLKNFLADIEATQLEEISKSTKTLLVKGTACENGGYVQTMLETPASISGKAWVYESLEEADKALVAGSIPDNSVIVVHNCVDTCVSTLAYTIEGMEKQSCIAIVTDGLCDKSSVLSVTRCTPNTFANEAFANIQTGDQLDIDLGRGRINTSISAKDLKHRAKKNSTKKQVVYFQ